MVSQTVLNISSKTDIVFIKFFGINNINEIHQRDLPVMVLWAMRESNPRPSRLVSRDALSQLS